MKHHAPKRVGNGRGEFGVMSGGFIIESTAFI
jgi:hypothetical protein